MFLQTKQFMLVLRGPNIAETYIGVFRNPTIIHTSFPTALLLLGKKYTMTLVISLPRAFPRQICWSVGNVLIPCIPYSWYFDQSKDEGLYEHIFNICFITSHND